MPIAPINEAVIKKHGDTLAVPLFQDGATLSEDGMGLRVLSFSLLVKDNESPSSFTTASIPQFGQEVIAGSKLYLSKRSKRYNRDGTITIDCEAVGIDPAYGDTTEIMVEGASTASAEPIETHPKFATQLAGSRTAPLNGAIFDETGKFLGFSTDTTKSRVTSQQPLAGVRSYLAPRNTLRLYFHTTNKEIMANCISQQTGKTSFNGLWNGVRFVPLWWTGEISELLLSSISTEPICIERGGSPVLMKVSAELMDAGDNGWNSLIYG